MSDTPDKTESPQDHPADPDTGRSAVDGSEFAAPAAAPRARSSLARVAFWLIVLAAIAALGYFGWQRLQTVLGEAQNAIASRDKANDQIVLLGQRLDSLEGSSRALPQQMEQASSRAIAPLSESTSRLQAQLDAANGERALLEERLRRAEQRAADMEQQIAELGDARMQGRERMLLDQAEFLLLGGAERLRVSGDRNGALDAYRLADRALAGLDSGVSSALRDSLAEEIRRLQALPPDPRKHIASELDAIGAALSTLPAQQITQPAESDSRLLQLMSRLVTVRRIDSDSGTTPLLDPLRRETAIAALQLDLALARGAASRGDDSTFSAALQRAMLAIGRLYDADDEQVADIQTRLEMLSGTSLAAPNINLGTTLSALRIQRAGHSDTAR